MADYSFKTNVYASRGLGCNCRSEAIMTGDARSARYGSEAQKRKVIEKIGRVDWKHQTRTVDPDMGAGNPGLQE